MIAWWPELLRIWREESSSVTSLVVLVHSRGKWLLVWSVFAVVAKAQLCSCLLAVAEV